MFLEELNGNGKAKIKVNSFYDVFPDDFSDEEVLLYNELTGLPIADSYEELMDSIKD